MAGPVQVDQVTLSSCNYQLALVTYRTNGKRTSVAAKRVEAFQVAAEAENELRISALAFNIRLTLMSEIVFHEA